MPITKFIFCANCGVETEQDLSLQREEVVTECSCGRFLKFPVVTEAEFNELVAVHKGQNQQKLFSDQE